MPKRHHDSAKIEVMEIENDWMNVIDEERRKFSDWSVITVRESTHTYRCRELVSFYIDFRESHLGIPNSTRRSQKSDWCPFTRNSEMPEIRDFEKFSKIEKSDSDKFAPRSPNDHSAREIIDYPIPQGQTLFWKDQICHFWGARDCDYCDRCDQFWCQQWKFTKGKSNTKFGTTEFKRS